MQKAMMFKAFQWELLVSKRTRIALKARFIERSV